MISDFRREVAENCSLLGYYAASIGHFLPTFRDNLSVPSSEGQESKGHTKIFAERCKVLNPVSILSSECKNVRLLNFVVFFLFRLCLADLLFPRVTECHQCSREHATSVSKEAVHRARDINFSRSQVNSKIISSCRQKFLPITLLTDYKSNVTLWTN